MFDWLTAEFCITSALDWIFIALFMLWAYRKGYRSGKNDRN